MAEKVDALTWAKQKRPVPCGSHASPFPRAGARREHLFVVPRGHWAHPGRPFIQDGSSALGACSALAAFLDEEHQKSQWFAFCCDGRLSQIWPRVAADVDSSVAWEGDNEDAVALELVDHWIQVREHSYFIRALGCDVAGWEFRNDENRFEEWLQFHKAVLHRKSLAAFNLDSDSLNGRILLVEPPHNYEGKKRLLPEGLVPLCQHWLETAWHAEAASGGEGGDRMLTRNTLLRGYAVLGAPDIDALLAPEAAQQTARELEAKLKTEIATVKQSGGLADSLSLAAADLIKDHRAAALLTLQPPAASCKNAALAVLLRVLEIRPWKPEEKLLKRILTSAGAVAEDGSSADFSDWLSVEGGNHFGCLAMVEAAAGNRFFATSDNDEAAVWLRAVSSDALRD